MKTIAALAKTLVVCALYATLTLVPILICLGATKRAEPREIELAPAASTIDAPSITRLSGQRAPAFAPLAANSGYNPQAAQYLAGGILALGLVAFALFRNRPSPNLPR